MSKYIKFFLGAVLLCAFTVSAVSCQDEEDYVRVHNGGSGK